MICHSKVYSLKEFIAVRRARAELKAALADPTGEKAGALLAKLLEARANGLY